MRRFQFFQFFCFFVFLFISDVQLPGAALIDRPKIGLVLSGGGALGFAHVGTLKLLDSLEIPIDYIAGTSMGGIMGALYATGYSGAELEKLAARTDWVEIFTDTPPRRTLPYCERQETGKYQLEFGLDGFTPHAPSGLIFGQKISLLFSSLTFPYEHIHDFDKLPIPFRCVAVDLVSGSPVVLKSGSLAKAMRSTMAIPTVFSPVEWGDSLLVDGGIMDNLPVDVVRDMGADIVIAVDVGNRLLSKDELNTVVRVLDQSIKLMGIERWKRNSANTDILIQPDLYGFGLGDFETGKISQIIKLGDAAAHENLSALLALKKRLNLAPMRNISSLDQFQKRPLIHSVQITGYTTIPFQTLYQQIGVKPGDECYTGAIQKRLAEMRNSGVFESVHYDIIPISDSLVRLLVHVKEKQAPQIYGIKIDGNHVLSFSFIYQMLGLHPGDLLNTDDLSRRIMKMYGLGYFENIRYDVAPIGDNRIRLILHVKELPRRKLKLGVRYNSVHKLVAVAGLESRNFPFAGMRTEYELQFAGLTQFKMRAYYPSRTLNLPLFPIACLYYKKIPIPIYDGVGQKIASYNDHSLSLGAGLGLTLGNPMFIMVTYTNEIMDIEPNIAMPDPTIFPSWKDHLKQIRASFDFDTIDNILLPDTGLRIQAVYEGSLKQLHTDCPYRTFSVSGDAYHTFAGRHTLRLFGLYATATANTPTYKLFYDEGPDQFVGLDYYQLTGRRFTLARLDYRYRITPSIYVKWIGNAVFNLTYAYPGEPDFSVDRLWGTGAGVTVMSFLGPIDFILARGSKGLSQTGKGENRVYFSFGYKF